MSELVLPTIKVKQRKIDEELEQAGINFGLHPLVVRIIASRNVPLDKFEEIISPRLSFLDSPDKLTDIDIAAARVAKAIINKECIGLETDHDCDGQTSHAVFYDCLINYFNFPKEKLRSYIGHRLTEGYGLSESVAKRILNDDIVPNLVITADNGSTDEPRISLLKENGIDVIVTDHHEIPLDGIPKSAYAVLNPTRKDCDYPDPYIAGCMVAWLLMAKTRQVLIKEGYLASDAKSIKEVLDFVAVGTVADCVSIAKSVNNRAVVRYGLHLISKGVRPCWQVILDLIDDDVVTSEDLGFKLGPLLNSDGRLACAFGSVSFLLSEDISQATKWLEHLQEKNKERKAIQASITDKSMIEASKQLLVGKLSLCIYLPEGHSGVHGIVASRVREAFGMPVIIFSPKQGVEGVLTGSARSTDELHLKDALEDVSVNNPNLLLGFGGHSGAAGASILLKDFDRFSLAFEDAVAKQINKSLLGPVVYTDGVINSSSINLNFIEELDKVLQPYGREFEAPVFEVEAKVLNIIAIGDKTHAALELSVDDCYHKAIWFRARNSESEEFPVKEGVRANFVVSLKKDVWRQEKRLKLQVLCVK